MFDVGKKAMNNPVLGTKTNLAMFAAWVCFSAVVAFVDAAHGRSGVPGCSDVIDAQMEIKTDTCGNNDFNATVEMGSGELSSVLSPLEERAKRGAELYEKQETRDAGLEILKGAASEGSPFALARLSAIYYLGEGGFRQDYDKALRLMKSAVAKGFPKDLLPIEATELACSRAKDVVRNAKSVIMPGDGYPGRLDPYVVTPELRRKLDRFNLTAGYFRRNKLADGMLKTWEVRDMISTEIPYLLFTPKSSQKRVPMVVYFGGTGEQGTDLMAHFHQSTIFSIITSPEFQKKHPCFLFAPMVPKGAQIRCQNSWSPPMADIVCDAMYAVIHASSRPRVDTNRIYLTGLSYGGSAAWTFPFGYPGRFAASVPVAGYATRHSVPRENPGNFWFIYNEGEYSSDAARCELADMAREVEGNGGEFRSSAFPGKGHNAWDKAWREDAVWDWMFSKTANGYPVNRATGIATPASFKGIPAMAQQRVICTASKPGRDGGTAPERAVDGLDATCYVSSEPFKKGDWWQVEFGQPISGRITVKSGYSNGKGRAAAAFVETTSNGRRWQTAGRFRRDTGDCTFVPRFPVKALRVVSESLSGDTLVLREVVVQ